MAVVDWSTSRGQHKGIASLGDEMARSGDVEKGEASRKRFRLPESERAKKKARPTENISKLSRKRAWSEVTETEYLNGDQNSSKKRALRVGSLRNHSGEGDKHVEDRGSRGSEPNTQESVSPSRETGVVQEPDLPQRKWKRTPKVAYFGGLESNSGPSGSCLRGASGDHQGASEEHLGTRFAVDEENEGKQKQGRENEVVRMVLQTVHLEESRVRANKHSISEHEESSIDLEIESADTVSSLEETALNGRDRKRREADLGEGSPPRGSEKKLRIDVAGAEGSHRSGEHATHTKTWKRLKRHNQKNSTAAAEDMRVSISEAWKRLRDWKDTETSGSSVNGDSDSDLSMHSCPSIPERIEGRSKKARYVSPLPSVGRKWKRHNREKKQSSSGKRQRDGNGCESSGSSGSDMAQSSYLHNRKWKRPRHENLMSVQGRSLRRQSRDVEEARKRTRKRVQGDASERSSKWPRK